MQALRGVRDAILHCPAGAIATTGPRWWQRKVASKPKRNRYEIEHIGLYFVSRQGRYSAAECIGARKERIEGSPDPKHVSIDVFNLRPARTRAAPAAGLPKEPPPHYGAKPGF